VAKTIDPSHLGHLQIENGDCDVMVQPSQRFLTIGGQAGREACMFQVMIDKLESDWIIVGK
jgi:hypothetical protein